MMTPQFPHERLARYLEDPLLRRMFEEVRAAGPVRSIQVDITHRCNIRCKGCYFFSEGMDQYEAPKDEAEFDAFLEQEKVRGTNYVTVTGGEPSMMLDRLKKIYDNFWMVVVTNGIRPIPYEGFENLSIAVSVWGDHETDKRLRGSSKIDVFARGLANYKDDPRAAWYYTLTPGNAHEVESVVTQCVENGNFVGFNFYGDIAELGEDVDHRRGFSEVCEEMERMIERYPHRIWTSSYLAHVVATGKLYDDDWGFDVCCTLSGDKEKNQRRFANGKAYNPHFRVYNPDLETTRVCCRSATYDCENCFDTWAHMAWIMANLEKHLGSEGEFTNWLSTMYTFYLANHIIDFKRGVELLPAIHQRLARWRRHGAWGTLPEAQSREEITQQVLETL